MSGLTRAKQAVALVAATAAAAPSVTAGSPGVYPRLTTFSGEVTARINS